MEIKPGKPFDIFTSGPVSGKGGPKEGDHEISIQDTVSESAPQEGAQVPGAVYGKPDAKSVQDLKAVKETTSTQSAAEAGKNQEAGETSPESVAVSAASTIVSGPVGAAISEQLKNLSEQNVEFFLRRRFYIPRLMSPFRQITEEKAAKILSGGNVKKKGRIHASVNEGSLARISGKAEVDELSAFKDQGPDSSLRNRDLAAFLKRATKEFYIESDDGKAKKAFGTYRYVLDGPQQGDMESPRTISFYYKEAKVLNVTPDEIRDIKRCEDTLTTSREVAEKLNGKPSLLEQVMKPIGDELMSDRLEIAKGLQKYTYSEETAHEFHMIRDRSKDGADFVKTGKLYLGLLSVMQRGYRDSKNTVALDFIRDRLKDHPDDYQTFFTMLKSGTEVEAAKKVFDCLPQPANEKDYEKAGEVFMNGKWSASGVEEVMKPPLDAPLQDRSDILEGLGKHIKKDDYNNNKSAWTIQKEDMQYLRDHSKDGAEFSKIGKLYVEALDSYGEEEWSQYYRAGLDFIIRRLKDNPDEFAVFKGLLSGGVSMSAAIAIFDTLTQPVKPGDYENAAKPFQGDKWWNGEWVQKAATPHDSTTLDERVDLIQKLRKHNYYGKEVAQDYDRLIQAFPKADDFKNAAAQYLEAIRPFNSSFHQEVYDKTFDFIKTRLCEHPDEHGAYVDLLKSGMKEDAARAVFDNLPKPVSQGDYASAAAALKDAKWSKAGVEEVMKPPLDAPLKDRSDLLAGLGKYIRKDDYDNNKNAWTFQKEDMQYLREHSKDGAEFSKIGKLYVETLDSYGEEEWSQYYRAGLDFIIRRLKDNPDEFAVFKGLLSGGVSMSTAIAIFDTLTQPVKPGDYENAAKPFQGDKWWNGEWVQKAATPHDSTTLDERVDLIKKLRKHNYYGKDVAADYDRLIQAYPNADDLRNAAVQYLEAIKTCNSSYHQSEYDKVFDFIKTRLCEHPDEHSAYVDLLKSGMKEDAARAVFDNLPKPVSQGDYASAAAALKDAKWSKAGVEEVMKPPLDAPLKDRSDLLAGLGKYIRKDDYDNNKNAWTFQKEDMQYLREHSKNGAEFSKIGKLYVEALDSYGEEEWSQYYRAGLDFIIRRLKDNPDEFAVFKGLLSGGVSMSAAIAIFDTLTQPVKPGDYENAAKPFQGDKWWNGEWVQKAATPHDSTTLDERVDLIKKLRKHNYYGKDVAADYDRLIQAYPNADDLRNAAAQYLEAIKTCNSSYHQSDYDKVFDFIKTRLSEHPDEHGAYVDLLKSGMKEDAARAVFENLPKPVSQGDYASAAAALKDAKWSKAGVEEVMKPPLDAPLKDRSDILKGLLGHIKYDGEKMSSWELAKKEMQYLRDNCSNGAEFAKLGKMYIKVLDACRAEEIDDYFHSAFELIRTRLQQSPDEFALFTALLENGIDMEDSLELFGEFAKPVRNESCEDRMKAFTSHLTVTFRKSRDSVKEAFKDYKLIADSIDTDESLQQGFDRFALLLKAIRSGGTKKDREGMNFLQATRDTFIWIKDEKKKQSFGNISSDDVTSMLLEELALGTSLDAAKRAVIFRCQKKEENHDVVADDDTVNIGGIKLDVKKLRNILHP